MGKASFSPLGQWSGKVGGQVYRVRNGEQVVSSYQPKVTNPRSAGQLMQRARFSLAAQISGITPDAAIYGMAASRDRRRPDFVSNLIRKSRAEVDPASVIDEVAYIGRISNVDVVFSVGRSLLDDTLIGLFASAFSVSGTGVAFDPTAIVGIPGEITMIRIVDLFGASVREFNRVEIYDWNADQSSSYTFNGVGVHRFYVIPVAPTSTGVGLPANDGLDGAGEDNELSTVLSAPVLSSDAFGQSVYVISVNNVQ